MPPKRVAILGSGKIANYLINRIQSQPELGVDLAFVACRRPALISSVTCPIYEGIDNVPWEHADLVVEAAHADWVRACATDVLKSADFMPLSLTALADANLEKQCQEIAEQFGLSLVVPEGAVTGLSVLEANRQNWTSVTITMRKNPRNIDLSQCEHSAAEILKPVELFRGTTREACGLFPRNVNSHAAVALAGIGFDRTVSVMIADPGVDTSDVDIVAESPDIRLSISRSNTISGVSGELTLKSAYQSMLRALKLGRSVEFC